MRRTAWLLVLCFVLMLTSCTGQGDDAASLSTTVSSTEAVTTTTTTTGAATTGTAPETTASISITPPTGTTGSETAATTATTGSAEEEGGVYFNDGAVAMYIGTDALNAYVPVTEDVFRAEYDLDFAPFLNESSYEITYELAYARDTETFQVDVSQFGGYGEVTIQTDDGSGKMALKVKRKNLYPHYIVKRRDGAAAKKSMIAHCEVELFNVEDSFLLGTFKVGDCWMSCFADGVTQAEMVRLIQSVIENSPQK